MGEGIMKRGIVALSVFVGAAMALGQSTKAPMPIFVAPSAVDTALVARLESALRLCGHDTPGQEAMNMLTNEWPKSLLPALRGEKQSTQGELEKVRRVIGPLVDTIEKGATWPLPPRVDVPYALTAPTIDGKLDDPAWKTAASFSGVYAFDSKDKRETPPTTWRLTWDTNCLYFAFECLDEDIEAPVMKRDDNVFFYDCVEMFILPEYREGVYWELVVGPTGSIYDGLNAKKFDGWGGLCRPEENIAHLGVGYSFQGTPNQPGDKDIGYTIEVAIPFRELPSYTRGNPPRPGDTLKVMLVRLDKNGDILKAYAFQPLLSWGHNIWNYAELRLLAPPEPSAAPSSSGGPGHDVPAVGSHEKR